MPALTVTQLNNGSLDANHLADVATSTEATATDRMGNIKLTVKGAIDTIKAFNSRGPWVTATVYAVKDLVSNGGQWYACVVAHTSSASFATDSPSKWRVHQGVTTTELSTDNGASGSALVVQPTEYADEQPTSVFSILRARANAKRFWVSGDGADWTSAINKMLASGARNLIIPGDVEYQSVGGHQIDDDQDLYFDGAEIALTSQTAVLFTAASKERWSIRGRVIARGSLSVATTQPETGLRITSGKRYVVDGFTATNFKGKGIHLDGTGIGSNGLRGDRGQFSNCAAHQSTTGLLIDQGAGGEYNSWSNFMASGNSTGILMDAGNNTFAGGCVVDNTTGIKLVGAGVNHAHGMITGMNINHNSGSNLHCQNVSLGFTFVANHFYGNVVGVEGNIWLENCKGILIANGVIDAAIYNDSGAGSGINRIDGNYFPTGALFTSLNSNNGGLNELMVSRNFDSEGSSAFNDPSPVYVSASRSSSGQSLSSGVSTTVLWNNEIADNRLAYDPGTGIFTAPVAGTYRITASVTVTGTGLTSGYGAFRVNSSLLNYAPAGLVSSTVMVVNGAAEVFMAAGATADFQMTATGATPAVSVGSSRFSVSLLE